MPVRRAALMLLLAATSAAAPATRPATRPLAPGASGLTADATPAGAAAYVESAEAYVGADPAAADAGAALMDALTVSVAAGNKAATQRLQRRILWDYPDSVAAAYLLTSNDFKALQPVFESFLPDDWYDAPPGLTPGLAAALRRPMARYGAALFADDTFALKVGLLFREAGDAATVRAALQRFETQRTNTAARAVALAVLDPNVAPTPADALAALEAFGDRRAVAPFELYFLRLLPKAARETPAMRRREALAALAASPPERALAAFDRLADGGAIEGGADVGRLQFLHAWAAARTGQYDRAADLMAAAKASGGPWGEAAVRLAPTLPGGDRGTGGTAGGGGGAARGRPGEVDGAGPGAGDGHARRQAPGGLRRLRLGRAAEARRAVGRRDVLRLPHDRRRGGGPVPLRRRGRFALRRRGGLPDADP